MPFLLAEGVEAEGGVALGEEAGAAEVAVSVGEGRESLAGLGGGVFGDDEGVPDVEPVTDAVGVGVAPRERDAEGVAVFDGVFGGVSDDVADSASGKATPGR